jgi:hypothetical protein
MAELGYELWIGDAAQITAMRVRKQKADRQDAQFLLKLLLEDRFPRVWMPSPENRDLRQLLWHRHRLVPDAYAGHESVAIGRNDRRHTTPARLVQSSREIE